MTSLSEQLKRLAVAQTSRLQPDKRRVSLLFSAEEAAKLDRETVFGIGINGFEELVQLDRRFADFGDFLFAEKNISFERSVETREVNDQLDRQLKLFLLRLSPYFQLKSSQKALEWLIYRYHIHEYNVSDVLRCSIPYYDTHLFARLLQILVIPDSDPLWFWLIAAQKSGLSMSRLTVVKHVNADLNFVNFLCNTVTEMQSAGLEPSKFQVWFSFLASTLIGALASVPSISDVYMTQMTPFLLHGCKGKSDELQLCSYMIICQIARKTQLLSPVVTEFITSILLRLRETTFSDALATVMVLCQTQECISSVKLSSKIAVVLCGPYKTALLKELGTLQAVTDCNEFFRLLITLLIEVVSDADSADRRQLAGDLLRNCIREFQLSLATASEMITLFIRQFIQSATTDDVYWVEICGRFSRSYPVALDAAVRAVVKSEKGQAERIRQLVADSHTKSDASGGTDTFLGLHHPNSDIRLLSAQQMFDSFAGKSSKVSSKEEMESYKRFFIETFKATDIPVIKLFVKHFHMVLDVLGEDSLLECLMNLFRTASSSSGDTGKRAKLVKVAKKLAPNFSSLTPVSYETTAKVVCFCLSRFLISCEEEMETAQQFIGHPALTKCGLMKHLKKDFNPLLDGSERIEDSFKEINSCLTDAVAHWLTERRQFDHERAGMLKVTKDLKVMVVSSLALMKCAALIDQKSCKMEVLNYLKYMLIEMSKFEKAPVNADLLVLFGDNVISEEFIFSVCKAAAKDMMSEEFCLLLRWNFLKQRANKGLLKGKWGTDDTESVEELLGIFQDLMALSRRNPSDKHLAQGVVQKFLQVFLPELSDLIKVTLICCLSDKWDVTVKCQLLKILIVAMKSVNISLLDESLKDESILIALLLVLLGTESLQLRELGADCVQILSDRFNNQAESVSNELFVKFLQSHQEECRADADQIAQIIARIPVEETSPLAAGAKTPKATSRRISRARNPQVADQKNVDSLSAIVISLFQMAVDEDTPVTVSVAILKRLERIQGTAVLNVCHKRVHDYMKRKGAIPSSDEELVRLLLNKYSPTIAPDLSDNSETFQTFKDVLHKLGSLPWGSKMLGLGQITPELFGRLQLGIQQEIVSLLLDKHFSCSRDLVEIAVAIKEVLISITLDSSVILALIPKPKSSVAAEPKNKRMKSISTIKSLSDEDVRFTDLILEVTLANFPSGDFTLLIPSLFELLKVFIEMNRESSIQLVLANLVDLGEKAIAVGRNIREESFNLELIVQCIREFTSSKVHQSCFRLLTVGAKLFKEYLLHHVLSIFTFMGSSLVRQDDSYSFHVIFRTLDTVIPAVVTASSKGNSGAIDKTIVEIFQVFVDSLPHIPDHRRQPLFQQLISAACRHVELEKSDGSRNADEFLWILIALLLARSVTSGKKSVEDTDEADETSESETEFACNLQFTYAPGVQLSVLRKLLHYTLSLPEKKSGAVKVKKPDLLFDTSCRTDKQLRHFCSVVVKHVYMSLQNVGFVSQLAELQPDEFDEIEVGFQDLMEECINGMNLAKTKVDSGSLVESDATFWRSFNHKCQQSLEKINLMLPTSTGLKAIQGLLQRQDCALKRCSLEVLNVKLLQNPTPFQKIHIPQLAEIVTTLGNWLDNSSSQSSDETELLQLGLYSVKLLTRVIAPVDSVPFKTVLTKIVAFVHQSDGSSNPLLISNAILCLAELVETLGSETLEEMPVFVPDLLRILKSARSNSNTELLLLSCVVGLVKVVESFGSFLSPYLTEIIGEGCVTWGSISSLGQYQTPIVNRLDNLQTHLASVPGRVLIPAVAEHFFTMSTTHPELLVFSFKILSSHFGKFSAEEVMQCAPALTPFFLSALDLRVHQASNSNTDEVELAVIEAFTGYAMKLSENSFRPVMFKLCEWASVDVDKPDRLIVLFRLCDSLAEKLRSLFTLFAGQLLKIGADCLDKTNAVKSESLLFGGSKKGKTKCHQLIAQIFDCFTKCFLYDNESFINRERFDMLLNPIIDQVENVKVKPYEDRIVGHFVPCLISLACAMKDDSAWKSLNYQLLLKTRDKSAKVRFSALLAADGLYERMGDEFSSLVPETVPFLAELLEDESEEVESQCRKVIAVIEKSLGESLQQYF